ncbi:MAG: hypothetical protein JY451_09655 [Erythrobacter sp.]|nr:MAG: hypothetical protein JY451_09655 [Erythrobacter sp.]
MRNAVSGERTRQAIAEGTAIAPETIDVTEFAEYTLLDISELPAPPSRIPTAGPHAQLHREASALLQAGWLDGAPLPDTALPESALLLNPSSLTPSRVACEEAIPALLVDLDPGAESMPLDGNLSPDPELVTVLDDLRRQGLTIAWITDREPQDAGTIRARLLEAGLDPTGRDPLFVQRYPGELKQARRRALLETHCLLAIAGDDRRDFDDLYLYLRDPAAALPLEAMLDDRWFLIPNPLD